MIKVAPRIGVAMLMSVRWDKSSKEGTMLGFLIRAALVALGLWLATDWVSGVSIDTPSTLVLAGILLGVVNSIVRPISIFLALPMPIPTLPFFLPAINPALAPFAASTFPC